MSPTRKPSMRGYPDPSVTLRPTPVDHVDVAGRGFLIVGGTDGLGRALAKALAARGAEVTVIGRTFRDEGVPGIRFVRADLSSMREARRLGQEVPVDGVDTVVLTTGIIAPRTRQVTDEGVEIDMAVSFLSRVAVLDGLLGRLRPPAGRRARVFVMGFPGAGNLGDPTDLNAERGYAATTVHMNTVAGNEALVAALAEAHPEVGFFGLNPGLIKTNIRAKLLGEGSLLHRGVEALLGLFTPTPAQYADRTVPLLVAPELEGRTGLHFGQKANPILPSDGMDAARARAFVDAARALITRAAA